MPCTLSVAPCASRSPAIPARRRRRMSDRLVGLAWRGRAAGRSAQRAPALGGGHVEDHEPLVELADLPGVDEAVAVGRVEDEAVEDVRRSSARTRLTVPTSPPSRPSTARPLGEDHVGDRRSAVSSAHRRAGYPAGGGRPPQVVDAVRLPSPVSKTPDGERGVLAQRVLEGGRRRRGSRRQRSSARSSARQSARSSPRRAAALRAHVRAADAGLGHPDRLAAGARALVERRAAAPPTASAASPDTHAGRPPRRARRTGAAPTPRPRRRRRRAARGRTRRRPSRTASARSRPPARRARAAPRGSSRAAAHGRAARRRPGASDGEPASHRRRCGLTKYGWFGSFHGLHQPQRHALLAPQPRERAHERAVARRGLRRSAAATAAARSALAAAGGPRRPLGHAVDRHDDLPPAVLALLRAHRAQDVAHAGERAARRAVAQAAAVVLVEAERSAALGLQLRPVDHEPVPARPQRLDARAPGLERRPSRSSAHSRFALRSLRPTASRRIGRRRLRRRRSVRPAAVAELAPERPRARRPRARRRRPPRRARRRGRAPAGASDRRDLFLVRHPERGAAAAGRDRRSGCSPGSPAPVSAST